MDLGPGGSIVDDEATEEVEGRCPDLLNSISWIRRRIKILRLGNQFLEKKTFCAEQMNSLDSKSKYFGSDQALVNDFGSG